MIKFKNVVLKHSKNFNTLQDINLQINKGEKVAVIGDESSGKHSISRIIGKMERPTSGEVFVNNKSIKDVNFKTDISMGYLRAIPVFFNNKTVKQNLQYVLGIRNLKGVEVEDLLLSTLEKYNISDVANLKIRKLSFYEKIVVSIARLDLRELDILVLEDVANLKNNEIKRKKGLRRKTFAQKAKHKHDHNLDFENVLDENEIIAVNNKINMLLNSQKNATVILFCEKNNQIISENQNYRHIKIKYGSIV